MRPTKLAEALDRVITVGMPTLVQGPPGVGKSEIIKQAAARRDEPMPVIDIRAVLLDPVDLRGLPRVNGDGKAHWCPPAFLPDDPDWRGVIFLDELPQAAPLVQSACLQLVLDRRLGEYELPAGAVIIAAGNRVEDRAGAHRIITPLLNRFLHLSIEPHLGDFKAWALQAKIDPRVTSFLEFRPELLFKFDPKSNAPAFPTPRAWSFVSRMIDGHENTVDYDLVAGCVGDAGAAEFVAFAELYGKLPDVNKVLADPAGHSVPSEPSVCYALTGALVDALHRDPSLADAFATYSARLGDEYAAVAFRDGGGVCNQVLFTPAGKAWIREHHDLILS